LKESYIKKGQARFTYRHLVVLGKLSEQASAAAECAREQGKFWEYHDKLFATDPGLGFTYPNLKQYAMQLKLNPTKFGQCLDMGRYRSKVAAETAAAASLGTRATPTFFVNGRFMVGAQPFDVFQAVIEEELGKNSGKNRN
jgi:protein-disulfide isomerase